MNSGLCRGGPYNMKPLHHPCEAFNVALYSPMKPRTMAQNPTLDVSVTYGTYRYRPDHKDWLWHPPKENANDSGNR